ncbi:MAG TPA: 50S ribosomal protein L11 methyltransferase [Methylibium sp.]|uniref:50S ribosomal protein L11 methyltransferase n=1 Tax=Methylibium sp. TaxID=2067992 RepID=UPI002DC02E62|nr:50S ribosomal protein L11 methyltransferase [Methylibium sp.]HEU4457931.1 50S ribosomal protein L11 methyltransferase [Methylibium sp.]
MHELVLHADEAGVEAIGDELIELGALSVSVEDAEADTPAERAIYGEPGLPAPREGWQRSILRALFGDEPAATRAVTRLLAQGEPGRVRVASLHAVDEQDWVRLTQSQFAPVEITPSFWIVPSWHAPPAGAAQVIRLDPGLAFGTGTHPTTRMCLRWTARQAERLRGARVLDYGCGSGILAIGAARFGAAAIDAIDIDPAAFASAEANAKANGVELRAGSPESIGAPAAGYGVVFANILASPLKLLAPLLAAHVAPGGALVLAGILERQADELRAAYASHLAIDVVDSEDGWILMTGRRAA